MSAEHRLNVTLWVPRFWPAIGGTELHTHELAKQLAHQHNVDVITHADTNECARSTLARDAFLSDTSHYRDGLVNIHRTGFNGIKRHIGAFLGRFHHSERLFRKLYSHYFRYLVKTRTLAITESSDVIHVIYNGLTDAALLAADHAKQHNIPFVFTPNVLDTSDTGSPWDSQSFHRLYQAAEAIIALTEHEADWLVSRGVCASKVSVVPYGPILEPNAAAGRFRHKIGAHDVPIILFLGRVVPIKGYDILLNAMKSVWETHPTAHLSFVGPATDTSRATITSLHDERITLIEDIDQQSKSDALAACDLLCVPSSMESLGVVYIEAAANAKPVVALKLPVLEHVIDDQKDGFLVHPNSDAISNAINRLLSDNTLRTTMGQHAKAKATRLYDWSVVTDSIVRVYRQAAIRHAARSTAPRTRHGDNATDGSGASLKETLYHGH